MTRGGRGAGSKAPPGALRQRLVRGLEALALDVALAEPLMAYLLELQRWNRTYNLTAVRDPAEMVTRHLLDSLSVMPALPDTLRTGAGSRLCDVGSGAGLPGIPLAIARPDWSVTLVDSVGKKVRFLRHVQRSLGLPNILPVEGRAENLPAEPPFDAVISRAFASLHDFVALTGQLAGGDGVWLAMKGKLEDSEIERLPRGFAVREVTTLSVPGLNEARHLVVVRRCAAESDAEQSRQDGGRAS